MKREEIGPLIEARREALAACAKSNATPEGFVRTRFLIGGKGTVLMACMHESTLSTEMDECVLQVVRETRFPSPRHGATVIVTYPFQFVNKP